MMRVGNLHQRGNIVEGAYVKKARLFYSIIPLRWNIFKGDNGEKHGCFLVLYHQCGTFLGGVRGKSTLVFCVI